MDEILAEFVKDKEYYENSGGGVTFSGGECMLQVDFLTEILKKCKENSIHTAVDTAGHIPFESFEKIFPFTDLFLYDIKIFDAAKHKQYVGVSNRLILENLKRLQNKSARIIVRIPVISGINDSVDEMLKIKKLLDAGGGVEAVELLPYHSIGESKYYALGVAASCFTAPDIEHLNKLKNIFIQ